MATLSYSEKLRRNPDIKIATARDLYGLLTDVVSVNIQTNNNTVIIGTLTSLNRGSIFVGNSANVTVQLSIGSAGKILRSDGTDLSYSTATFANTYGASELLYSNGANNVAGLITASDGVLITSATGVPSISSTLPNAVQDNITRLGTIVSIATPLGVAFGGTAIVSYTIGDLIYASGATTLSKLADVTAGSFLRSGGVGVAPAWSTTILPNAATTGDLIYASAANTYSNLADVAVGSVLISGGIGAVPSWSDSPVISTSITCPIIQGSSAVAGTLTLRANSTGTDGDIIFQSGSTTERARILGISGSFVIGNTALIGTEILSVQKNQNAITQFAISNTTSGTGARSVISAYTTGTVGFSLSAISAGYTTSGMFVANTSTLHSTQTGGLNIGTFSSSQTSFWTNNAERIRILSSGQFMIGYSSQIATEFVGIQKNQNNITYNLITNTTSGTAAAAGFVASNSGTLATQVALYAISAGYTTSGMFVADAGVLRSSNIAGLNIGTFSNTQMSGWTNNLKRFIVPAAGGFAVGNGTAALATTATDGFLHIPSCNGAPTGIPNLVTGTVPLVWDSTNKKLYIYDGGAWIGGTNPGTFT